MPIVQNVVLEPSFTGSAYPSGTDTHVKTDWVIKDSNNNVIWNSLGDTTNLTNIQIPAGVLQTDTVYTLEVKYYGNTTETDVGTLEFKTI